MKKNTGQTKQCVNCGKEYPQKYGVAFNQFSKSKFCSKPCAKEFSFKRNIRILAPSNKHNF